MSARRTEQEDYLIRMIQQAARALARLRELLTGRAAESATVREEARAELAQQREQILGEDGPLLTHLDAASAVRLLGSRRRLELWIETLELEAECWRADGDAPRAAALTERARDLARALDS